MSERDTRPEGAGEGQAGAGGRRRRSRWGRVLLVAHLLGLASSVDALMSTRTSQGAIAWLVSLNTLPVVAVPAYWIFGRTKFQGYVTIRRELHEAFAERAEELLTELDPYVVRLNRIGGGELVGERLAEMPYLRGNRVDLLIDGEATFASILEGIRQAREFVFVQFYIVRADGIGLELRDAVIAKQREGVPVWFLYDEVGSHGLPDGYVEALRDAGVQVTAFHSTRGSGNRFQLNFRNHRKIVVVDGVRGWVGGHNVGDEYLGRDPAWAGWRDTHVRIEGPAVLQLQLSFLEDWRWATEELLDVPWNPRPARGGEEAVVLVLPSGPADRLETASLMIQQAVHSARERLWIATPYFVPDDGVTSALHLAEMRGVDVKVIVPDEPDSKLVYYSTYEFADDLLESGVEIYRYQPGFLHQKVFLVDDVLAAVGTANLDNRSFRLNFEVTALVIEEDFVAAVDAMLRADLERSRPMTVEEVRGKPWWFRALARASFLTAPIQ